MVQAEKHKGNNQIFRCNSFTNYVSQGTKAEQGQGLVNPKLVEAPYSFLLLAIPRQLFCFGSLVF